MVEFRTALKGRKEYPKVIMPEEKDKISHRGQALRKMEQMLSAMQNGETNK